MKDHDGLRSQAKIGVIKFEKNYPGNLSTVISDSALYSTYVIPPLITLVALVIAIPSLE